MSTRAFIGRKLHLWLSLGFIIADRFPFRGEINAAFGQFLRETRSPTLSLLSNISLLTIRTNGAGTLGGSKF